MNLRKQVEPLQKAALQASSLQRRAHHAASRLTWVKRWLKRAYRHHAQSRELKLWGDLTPTRRYGSRQLAGPPAPGRGGNRRAAQAAVSSPRRRDAPPRPRETRRAPSKTG